MTCPYIFDSLESWMPAFSDLIQLLIGPVNVSKPSVPILLSEGTL